MLKNTVSRIEDVTVLTPIKIKATIGLIISQTKSKRKKKNTRSKGSEIRPSKISTLSPTLLLIDF